MWKSLKSKKVLGFKDLILDLVIIECVGGSLGDGRWEMKKGISVFVEVKGMSIDGICELVVVVRVGGISSEDLGERLVMIGGMFASVWGDEWAEEVVVSSEMGELG